MTSPQMYNAKLVSGREYRLRNPDGRPNEYIVFAKGQDVIVSAEVKTYLEKSALDPVIATFSNGETETEDVGKFEFTPAD